LDLRRSTGILLDPRSLPGEYGIGDLGPNAYQFADFLADCGVMWWQILPLGMPADGRCPYACDSAFARNPFLISPQSLVDDGLLDEHDLQPVPSFPDARIDFAVALPYKTALLEKAFERWQANQDAGLRAELESFAQRSHWLADYCLYRALKEENEGRSWNLWPRELVARDPRALAQAADRLRRRVEAHQFFQWLFDRQWGRLRNHCRSRGIKIIGDMPIFVSYDSSDVWTRPELFKLDENYEPQVVSGVPPDYFAETGQLWGNPLYNWDANRREGYAWWIERLRASLELMDALRVDHFRGFQACYEVPAGAKTAINGQWVETPGAELLETVRAALGDLPIFAEDLGVITPEVEKLRDDFGLAGMRVLLFGLGGDSEDGKNPHVLHKFPERCVAYTGTHDNDTIVGWFGSASEKEKDFALKYLRSSGSEFHWDVIASVLRSPAAVAIIPLQDVLGLGSWARMNEPGTVQDSNWSWRFKSWDLDNRLTEWLMEMNSMYGRVQGV